ncbi:DUF1304 domain-containing protein [Rhodohalobacter mucosus]|uniref:DUF1304 domain-containing protein n=1 Tax=Rhodohalobacter mucosus TaxID=2079485 RepID=UPI003BFA7476
MLQILLISIVALLHIGFMILEMILWERPAGRRIFGTTKEFAASSRKLAMNQGLYNGFLAAGLIWGLFLGPSGLHVIYFFLICVVIAGIFGAATVNRRIFWVQAAPALIAFAVIYYS